MEKIFKANAKKIIEFNTEIVARNEEEALAILDNYVYKHDVFSSKDDYKINLSVEEKEELNAKKTDEKKDNYEIKKDENCEQFCPIIHLYVFDE